jgi:hypothetical protein
MGRSRPAKPLAAENLTARASDTPREDDERTIQMKRGDLGCREKPVVTSVRGEGERCSRLAGLVRPAHASRSGSTATPAKSVLRTVASVASFRVRTRLRTPYAATRRASSADCGNRGQRHAGESRGWSAVRSARRPGVGRRSLPHAKMPGRRRRRRESSPRRPAVFASISRSRGRRNERYRITLDGVTIVGEAQLRRTAPR